MIIVRPAMSLLPPIGMYRAVTGNMESTAYVPITNMTANPNLPGSVVSNNALVSQTSGAARIAYSATMKPGDSAIQYVAAFKNGVLIPGSEVSAAGKYNGLSVLFGSATTTLNVGDLIDFRWKKSTGAWAVSMMSESTRLNVVSASILPAGATSTASFSPVQGWNDVPSMSPDPGTTLSGNSIVAPSTNPAALLVAAGPANVNDSSSLRFLINDSVAVIGTTIPAYDQTIWVVGSAAVNAGDLIRVQFNRGLYSTTIPAGLRFAVL